jgi:hypothetical protein
MTIIFHRIVDAMNRCSKRREIQQGEGWAASLHEER